MSARFGDGIVPHRFAWIVRGRLAVCEKPGGVAEAHRRVRRREELAWIARNDFELVVVLSADPGQLSDYDASGVAFMHRPLRRDVDALSDVLSLIDQADGAVLVHSDRVDATLGGFVAGWLLLGGYVSTDVDAVHATERLIRKPLGHIGTEMMRTTIKTREAS